MKTRVMWTVLVPAVVLFAGTAAALGQRGGDDAIVARAPAGPALITGVGEGVVRVKPDRATLTLGVEVEAAKSGEAQAELNARMGKVVSALKGSGVADQTIQTGSVSLSPVYVYEPRDGGQGQAPKLTGFRAASTVTVRTGDLAMVGRLIDAAVAAGGNRVDGISFDLKDDAKARREALTLATRNAREQAAAMAEALGLPLGRVVSAQSGVREAAMPRPMAMSMKAAGDGGGAVIEAGEVTVGAEATVVFEAGR